MKIRKSKRQPLVLTYDNIIVGHSLEAVLFSHQSLTPLICNKMQRPYYFETIEDFGLGTNKLDIWDRHMFLLSLGGLAPFSDKVKHLRYVDANTLKVATHEDVVVTVKFNRMFLFDDQNIYDLPPEVGITNKELMVVDWMKVISGRHHDLDYIDRDNKFINRVIFHEGGRPNLDKQKKDCIAISYLTERQLYDDKYAEYVVRLRTGTIMAEHGVKQNHNLKIAIEHLRRDVVKLGRNIYPDFDNVIWMDCEPKTAWQFGNPRSKINYLRYMKSKLGM